MIILQEIWSLSTKRTFVVRKLTQVFIDEKILKSLISRFNYFVCSIEETNYVTFMSMDELQSNLLVHEKHTYGHKDGDQVLMVSNAGRGNGRNRCCGRDRGKSNKETCN